MIPSMRTLFAARRDRFRPWLGGALTRSDAGIAHRARVQSITASSAIEGVVVANAGRAERAAQDYLLQDWRPLNAGLILHLHRLLFAHTAMPGGAFKTEDNLVVDRSLVSLAPGP